MKKVCSFLFVFLFINLVSAAVIIEPPTSATSSVTIYSNATNHTEYWDTDIGSLNDANATQMSGDGETLSIKESWFTTLWNIIFGTKTTDDLNEGSANFYENISWNESRATTLFGGGTGNASWNESGANLLYAPIGSTGNVSWNESYADSLYKSINNDSVFNITYENSAFNDSSFNATYDAISSNDSSFNATYDAYSTNVSLNYTEITYNNYDARWYQVLWDAVFNSSFSDRFDALFGAKSTDDLGEGSTNLYENQSFNETYTNTLYGSGGNASWNESFANTKYKDINNDSVFNITYENSALNDSMFNLTYENAAFNDSTFNATYDAISSNDSSYNATYDAYSLNVSLNYTEIVYNTYDTRWYHAIWDTVFNNTLTDYLTTWLTGKTTDDLTEGSTNLYENQSFNETYTNTLYGSGGNASWNESFANEKYRDIINASYNATYDAKVSFNNINLAYTNETNIWTENQNFSSHNITDVSYIQINEVTGNCDLTRSHTICSNNSGTYIIG